MYAGLLKNILTEFIGNSQQQVDNLEDLQHAIYEELIKVGMVAPAGTMFHCSVCGMSVSAASTIHTTGTVILCPFCAGKLLVGE